MEYRRNPLPVANLASVGVVLGDSAPGIRFVFRFREERNSLVVRTLMKSFEVPLVLYPYLLSEGSR